MRLITLLAAVAILSGCANFSGPSAPQPAKPVDISRYLGRWHEVARYPNGFERGCVDVTAEYALEGEGKIRVLNSCRVQNTNRIRQAKGHARVVGGNGARLEVSFFRPFYSDYWVLDRADDYSWALVGDSSKRLFWILSRTKNPANLEDLIKRAEDLGYDRSRLILEGQVAPSATDGARFRAVLSGSAEVTVALGFKVGV